MQKSIKESANMCIKISVLAFILALTFVGQSHADAIDWPKVDAAVGKAA
jgi:hypothetical protein